MASSRLSLTFRIFHNDQLVRETSLAQSVIKIGKVPSAHLRIDDDSVSRMHAILEVTGDQVHIIDLGSTRGTFINGQRINKARLKTGDTITIGDTRVEVAISEAAPAGATAPASPAYSASSAAAQSVPAPLASLAYSTSASTAEPAYSASAAPAHSASTGGPGRAAASTSSVSGAMAHLAPTPMPSASVAISSAHAPSVAGVVGAAAPPPVPARPASSPSALAMSTSSLAITPTMPAARAVTAGGPLAMAAPAPAAFQAAMADTVDDVGGARAVEVAAMLGDSVVQVKHCIDPRGGKVTSTTWGFLAMGVTCLLASVISFYVSVSTAASNKSRLDRHTRIEHKPVGAFRPEMISPAVDWVAFGGLALGLLGVTAALARARGERRSPFFRIGTAPGVEQPVERAPSDSFPLVAPSGDDFVFNFAPGIDGELILDGRSTPLAELAAAGRARPSAMAPGALEIAIPPKARIRAVSGQTTFLVTAVAPPRRHATPLLAGLESRTLKYIGGSLVAHLAVWLLLQQIPVAEANVGISLDQSELINIASTSTMKDEVPPEPEQDTGTGDPGATNTTTPMALEQGAAGDPKNPDGGHIRIADRHTQPQLSRDEAVAEAQRAGILGSSAALQDNIRSMTAQADFSSGFDDANIYGPLEGADGPGRGNFGMGKSGFGPGGGCTIEPCGIIGTGTSYHGLIATGKYAGDGYWAGGGGGRMRNHLTSTPPVRISEPTGVTDGLDKAIIKRYVRRSLNRISYCYEHELLARPSIEGVVSVQFLISASGGVTSTQASGFDPSVTSCVASVVKSIQFPRPTNGGNVQVNYPFTFHVPAR